MSNKNALEVKPIAVAMGSLGVSLTTMEDAWRFCKALEQSGVAPKGMKQAAIFAVIQSGAELGLSPMRALSNMKVINGRVGPMGSLAKALVRKEQILQRGTGFKEKFTGTEGQDDWTAHFTTHRIHETDEYHTTFSVKDAKRAALWGKAGPWTQYPKRMLMWRAVGFHMDDYYSDVLMGFHIAEVLADYPDERVPVTMEHLETPAKDPLLDELEEVAKSLQPGDSIQEKLEALRHSATDPLSATIDAMRLHPIITDPIEGPENIDGELVDTKTGEFLGEAPMKPKQATPVSPLSQIMAEKAAEVPPMSEEEAMADLIREGVVKDEDLAPVDPANAAEEGEDQKPQP